MIHRNVTPSNVLVGRGGFAKLSDLALAKRSEKKGELGITKKGQIVARSPYAPPESLLGERMDSRSDVYGVGATLFRTLAGCAPFGEDLKQLPQRALAHQLEPMPRLSPELQALLDRALQPDPAQRFQRMADLREALADLPELG